MVSYRQQSEAIGEVAEKKAAKKGKSKKESSKRRDENEQVPIESERASYEL
jgi:hypothetical protein